METKTATIRDETSFLTDLDKPSLHALSYALRHPDTWPEGFIWDYGECTRCAMGLAHALWESKVAAASRSTGASIMARTFAMPFTEASYIFMGGGQWVPRKSVDHGWHFWKMPATVQHFEAVTPDMVADQIDMYLAERAE